MNHSGKDLQFSDKVALITGGGSGIGRATAIAFSERGATSVVLDQDAESAEAVSAGIRAAGGKAFAVVADVSAWDQTSAAFEQIRRLTSGIDILVNSAGIYVYTTALELEERDWDRCFAVDLKGAWFCSKLALPAMIASGGGSIINIASTHAVRAQAHAFPYGVAKAGLLSLTNNLAVDYGEKGVRVNAICPGLVFTPLTTQYLNENTTLNADRMVRMQPLPVRIQPEDIANAVLFLASDMARCITGATLFVDGGRTIFSGIRHSDPS
ncbi:MAG: SDR family NAD(P)-dependent oxidoreductase [Terriglobia bacterium]